VLNTIIYVRHILGGARVGTACYCGIYHTDIQYTVAYTEVPMWTLRGCNNKKKYCIQNLMF